MMDSPRLNPKDYKGIKRKIAKLENSLYSKMPKTRYSILINCPYEVAVERNRTRIKEGTESEEFIRIRHKENQKAKYIGTNMLYKVDTDVPYWTNKED